MKFFVDGRGAVNSTVFAFAVEERRYLGKNESSRRRMTWQFSLHNYNPFGATTLFWAPLGATQTEIVLKCFVSGQFLLYMRKLRLQKVTCIGRLNKALFERKKKHTK